MFRTYHAYLTIGSALLGIAVLVGTAWWVLFAPKPHELTSERMTDRYAHASPGAQRARAGTYVRCQP